MPEALIRAVEDAGILEPERAGREVRYTEADVALARTGLALLSERLPLAELLGLAIHQSDATREVVDRAIDLFDRHVRREASGAERPADAVIEAFRRMLPAVTALVANHFQRTSCRVRWRASSSWATRTACATRSPPPATPAGWR